jgi:hypothetical protein
MGVGRNPGASSWVLFRYLVCASHQAFTEYNAKPAIYGVWSVDEFALNGQVIPVSAMNPARWHRFIVDNSFEVSLLSVDGARDRYRSKIDMKGGKLTLTKRDNPTQVSTFSFSSPQADSMVLEGFTGSSHLSVKLHRVPDSTFLLNTRGFHWINEYPYNH